MLNVLPHLHDATVLLANMTSLMPEEGTLTETAVQGLKVRAGVESVFLIHQLKSSHNSRTIATYFYRRENRLQMQDRGPKRRGAREIV